jgi:hypothetical protein
MQIRAGPGRRGTLGIGQDPCRCLRDLPALHRLTGVHASADHASADHASADLPGADLWRPGALPPLHVRADLVGTDRNSCPIVPTLF